MADKPTIPTTNIPPLMPAGYTRPDEESSPDNRPTPPAEGIGPLRAESELPRTDGQRPRQRKVRIHTGRTRRFFRRHWWWMLLIALLGIIAASLPWVMHEWEERGDEVALPADTPKVAPQQPVAVPDTTGMAARADSLRNDSIRRARAHYLWLQQKAREQAEAEAAAEAEDGKSSGEATTAHSDSTGIK